MKYLSPAYSQASGSIAGITYSHNKGGNYTRARVTPTNPSSAQQAAVRTPFGTNSSRWVNILTGAQRTAWDTYAGQTPLVDALGQSITRTGLNMYHRTNVTRAQLGLAQIDDGPTVFDLGEFTPVTFTSVSASSDELTLTFDNTDDWANEDDAYMVVYASRGQNASINFFGGPYRFAGQVDGDSGTAPTSPATIALPFAVTAAQRVFFYVRALRADGRLSMRQSGFQVAS